jgi:hypothetical protein
MKTKYFAWLPLFLMLLLAGCSSSDDDYQAGPTVKADAEQVYFTTDNEQTVILDPTDLSSYKISLKVKRNSTKGALAVPVKTNSTTTKGVVNADSVYFADGDSIASFLVTIPDTAKSGEGFNYSYTLEGDEVDPYTYINGGISFSGMATIPATVKLKCWITGYLDTPWEETALDLTGGHYRITNFMHSGYGIDFTISGSKLNVTLPPDSPLYSGENEYGYGTEIWWYTDDYVHLYPYGKDGGTDVTEFVILSNVSSYNKYYESSKAGFFYIEYFQTSAMANEVNWAPFYFQFE